MVIQLEYGDYDRFVVEYKGNENTPFSISQCPKSVIEGAFDTHSCSVDSENSRLGEEKFHQLNIKSSELSIPRKQEKLKP